MRKKLDPHTFSDSDAAVTLAKILSQEGYERYCSRVSTKYHEFCEMMWAIFDIQDDSLRSSLFHLVWSDNREKVSKMDVPEDVRSYLLNIMNAVYKKNVRHCNSNIIAKKANENRERSLSKNKN